MNENVSNAQSNENVLAPGQGLSANWIFFSALNLTSWDSFFFSPSFFVSLIFFNLLKGRDFLLMGNLYFIIKMEHNMLGLASLLRSRFFGQHTLGIKERLTFQQVYLWTRNSYLWNLRYNLTSNSNVLIILYVCRSLNHFYKSV